MKMLLAIVIALSLILSAQAQYEEHVRHQDHVAHPADAHIVVTINPEARVSAVVGAPLPVPPTCGSAMTLTVKVINQGFVTAPLRAAIAGNEGAQVALHLDEAKL